MKLWSWAAAVLALVCIGVILVIWLVATMSDAQQAKVNVMATLIAAAAAIGSMFAALASLTSARESTEVARQARRAMMLHNRPTGWLRSWCRYDENPEPGLVRGESLLDFGEEEVKLEIQLEGVSGVTAARFSYVTPAGDHAPLSVIEGKLLALPGVVPLTRERYAPGQVAPVNVSQWILTCRDRETRTQWRASGMTESGLLDVGDIMGGGLEFDLVE